MQSEFNGLLLIDKDQGVTSHDVVSTLRKILNFKNIGHAGTLDPMATGLLVCLVGEATKLSQYVMAEDKSYRIGIKLGINTDSGDVTGKVIRERETTALTDEKILSEIQKLVGVLHLKVPKYSAIKISGKKLYEYARENEEVELPSREMIIHNLLNIQILPENRICVDMNCGKGTYVRSWAEKLGENLRVGACVDSLRRLSSGPFQVSESVTTEVLSHRMKETPDGALSSVLVPMKDVLRGWPSLKLYGRDASLLSHGQIPHGITAQLRVTEVVSGLRLLDDTGGLLALMVKDREKGFKLARVFKPC